ncbi:hypothetical protein NDU88_007474 [Pleurodeles waltl]|uniref:Uncharacterized protein n=1 Tax=Pleurodeles waltl TaxID=8319 RepID=A0AAV7N604_PLEWA|nr:hypothetical protein NDU88_007474 [Pleurodeles waltl]
MQRGITDHPDNHRSTGEVHHTATSRKTPDAAQAAPPGNTTRGTGSGLQATLDAAQAAVSRERQRRPSQRPQAASNAVAPATKLQPSSSASVTGTERRAHRHKEIGRASERHTTGPRTTFVANLWCSKKGRRNDQQQAAYSRIPVTKALHQEIIRCSTHRGKPPQGIYW